MALLKPALYRPQGDREGKADRFDLKRHGRLIVLDGQGGFSDWHIRPCQKLGLKSQGPKGRGGLGGCRGFSRASAIAISSE